MVTKGGYRLIDFGGVDISTSKTISGIYNKIANTDKRIVGCNITLGTTKFKELTLDVKANGTSYELSNSILKITITNANAVVGENSVTNIIEDIKDESGNHRFIEGVITTEEVTGVNFLYKKWSLSGTHLMFVLAGTIDANSTISSASFGSALDLPNWVKDKIINVWSSYIEMKTFSAIDDGWSEVKNLTCVIGKDNNEVFINSVGTFTNTLELNFRVQFDLLIDME